LVAPIESGLQDRLEPLELNREAFLRALDVMSDSAIALQARLAEFLAQAVEP
jgi:hypothetical protein